MSYRELKNLFAVVFFRTTNSNNKQASCRPSALLASAVLVLDDTPVGSVVPSSHWTKHQWAPGSGRRRDALIRSHAYDFTSIFL
jgi:hypothetical protein